MADWDAESGQRVRLPKVQVPQVTDPGIIVLEPLCPEKVSSLFSKTKTRLTVLLQPVLNNN